MCRFKQKLHWIYLRNGRFWQCTNYIYYIYTVSQKRAQLWNGIARNYNMHALCSVCSLRDDSVITSKPTWKLKHANSILETWIFLPNIIKIDPYNFELYRFKVGPFFETQCILLFHSISLRDCRLGDLLYVWFFVCECAYCIFVLLVYFFLFFQYCWLGLLTCKTVSQITYTVLAESLNPAQSINYSISLQAFCVRWNVTSELKGSNTLLIHKQTKLVWGCCESLWTRVNFLCDTFLVRIVWGTLYKVERSQVVIGHVKLYPLRSTVAIWIQL